MLLYQAQTLGAPGVNAPAPWGSCPNPQDYYWIPLPDVVHDSAWGSKDHKLVISTLQQLQTTLVESDDPSGHFTSVQLIGSVHLLKGSGRRPSMVGWEFPRSTRDILSNPDFYTKLEERINDKSMEPVKAPAAFFRKALKDDYVSTSKVKPKVKPVVEPGPKSGQGPVVVATDAESRATAERKARVEKALGDFEALPELEKTNVIGEFHVASVTHKRMKPGGVMFQKTLGNWLVDNEGKPATSIIG